MGFIEGRTRRLIAGAVIGVATGVGLGGAAIYAIENTNARSAGVPGVVEKIPTQIFIEPRQSHYGYDPLSCPGDPPFVDKSIILPVGAAINMAGTNVDIKLGEIVAINPPPEAFAQPGSVRTTPDPLSRYARTYEAVSNGLLYPPSDANPLGIPGIYSLIVKGFCGTSNQQGPFEGEQELAYNQKPLP